MTDDTASDVQDERQIELATISAIFPELLLDAQDPFKAFLDIPVTPSDPLPIVFLAPLDGTSSAVPDAARQVARPKIHLISHLPYLRLEITLPTGYPAQLPPSFKVSTMPQWLPRTVLDRLEADGERLWEELRQDQTIYAFIDHLQQALEDAFGLLKDRKYLELPQDQQASLLDFDVNTKRAAFDNETFACSVCLDPKKGSVCHRMVDCGHVFCQECLQDCYHTAIEDGDVSSVRCLEPDCAKTRSMPETSLAGKRDNWKTNISSSELLQIPLQQEMVKRYSRLKRMAELASDKNTVYCPRKWCSGAARSTTRPQSSNNLEEGKNGGKDPIDEEVSEITKTTAELVLDDLLCICEDCSYAFCRRCYQGWHGTFDLCIPRTTTGELKDEDKASLEYLRLHSTPCPTCAAPAQKTQGCNHMICFRCKTHFCYLCSAWLEVDDPYTHFNTESSACFERLWELEAGDGDDVGIGFDGGVVGQESNDEGEEELIALQVEEIRRGEINDVDVGGPDIALEAIEEPQPDGGGDETIAQQDDAQQDDAQQDDDQQDDDQQDDEVTGEDVDYRNLFNLNELSRAAFRRRFIKLISQHQQAKEKLSRELNYMFAGGPDIILEAIEEPQPGGGGKETMAQQEDKVTGEDVNYRDLFNLDERFRASLRRIANPVVFEVVPPGRRPSHPRGLDQLAEEPQANLDDLILLYEVMRGGMAGNVVERRGELGRSVSAEAVKEKYLSIMEDFHDLAFIVEKDVHENPEEYPESADVLARYAADHPQWEDKLICQAVGLPVPDEYR